MLELERIGGEYDWTSDAATTALLAVPLTGILIYNVWWVVGMVTEPVVDWWALLGPCVGRTWFALLAAQTAHRAITLRRKMRAVGGET
ncbi:hypothetical protein [Streptomyces sp. NPDC029526]|uniref:hypothetical protein n=1 Tax=Streptomyces sp. NPDC029526 TaxID=3155728 RepID=UPI0033C2279B